MFSIWKAHCSAGTKPIIHTRNSSKIRDHLAYLPALGEATVPRPAGAVFASILEVPKAGINDQMLVEDHHCHLHFTCPTPFCHYFSCLWVPGKMASDALRALFQIL